MPGYTRKDDRTEKIKKIKELTRVRVLTPHAIIIQRIWRGYLVRAYEREVAGVSRLYDDDGNLLWWQSDEEEDDICECCCLPSQNSYVHPRGCIRLCYSCWEVAGSNQCKGLTECDLCSGSD